MLRQLWDADVEAFRDHWGGFDDSDEAFESWLAEPDLDPTLCVVAWDGDEIAGAVINTINAHENSSSVSSGAGSDSVFVPASLAAPRPGGRAGRPLPRPASRARAGQRRARGGLREPERRARASTSARLHRRVARRQPAPAVAAEADGPMSDP